MDKRGLPLDGAALVFFVLAMLIVAGLLLYKIHKIMVAAPIWF